MTDRPGAIIRDCEGGHVHDDDHDDDLDDDFDDEVEDDLDDDDFDDEVEDDLDDDDFDDEVEDDFDDEVTGDDVGDLGDDVDDEVVVAAVADPDGAAARRRSRMRAMAFGGVAVAALVLGWFVVRPAVSDDSSAAPADTGAAGVEGTVAEEAAASGEEMSATTEEGAATTVEEPEATVAEEGAAADEDSSVTTEEMSATTVEEPEATVAEEQTSTTAQPRSTTTVQGPATTAAEASGSVTYDTLPDGSPAPVVAVYDVDRITLTGGVPSEAARERLEALAVANAKPGQADTVDNLLTVNPDVPIGVGVRVVELTSVRFPPRSTEVLPAHARELDRAVAIMEALPNISALVIGHTDQVGDPLRNFAVSEQRADAVVNYMASQGIAPDRLASRAVGEEDLLTLADDEVARALNRRTEFVFYGLLVE